MIKNKKQLFELIAKNRSKISAFGVKQLGLFGSFVRGEQSENSDIDFVVEFKEGKKNFDNFIHLSFLLEDLLKHRIELVTPETLSPYIKPYVFKEVEYVPLGS